MASTATAATTAPAIRITDPEMRGLATFYGLSATGLGVFSSFGARYPQVPGLVVEAFFDQVLTRPGIPGNVLDSFGIDLKPAMVDPALERSAVAMRDAAKVTDQVRDTSARLTEVAGSLGH